ncbi:MAG: formaldehyde-activating enzyme [Pirellulales bacterium]
MAKKKATIKKATPKKKVGRIVLKTGEALVEEAPAWSAAETEVVIGELDGPVGYAIADLIGNQVKGHTKVFAILNSDVQVKPATVMVSKVTVNKREVHQHPDGNRASSYRSRSS